MAVGGTASLRRPSHLPIRLPSLTTWCAIKFGTSLPGVLALPRGGGLLPGGGAVGHQRADRPDGLVQVFPPSYPALQGPPVLGIGYRVLDADPLRGLGVAGLLVRFGHLRRRVPGGLLRRRAHLTGVASVPALAAGVHLALHIRVA